MPQLMPACSLIAVPGRRMATVEVAREMERRGYAGIFAPSIFSNMSLCEALAWNTSRIPFATAIAPGLSSGIVLYEDLNRRPVRFGTQTQPLSHDAMRLRCLGRSCFPSCCCC